MQVLSKLLMLILFVLPAIARAEFSVTFLNPGGRDDIFFNKVVEFMNAATDDLDIKLEVVYSDGSHMKMLDNGKAILNRAQKPDYLLMTNDMNCAVKLLPLAKKRKVKVMLFNEGIFGENVVKMGKPGEKYANWVAELLPDDYQSGYLLAKTLIEAAKEKGVKAADGKIYIVGLTGTFKTNSSIQRVNGLKAALKEYPGVELLQVIPALYDEAKAESVTKGVLRRYKDVNVIWAASDGMAIGAMKAALAKDRKPGVDLLLGGVDWIDDAIEKVGKQKLDASVGGHFMDGAWAMVILYDYHNGKHLNVDEKSRFSAITANNYNVFKNCISSGQYDRIDFKKFSKVCQPMLNKYDFGLDSVLRQLTGCDRISANPATKKKSMVK